MEVLVRAKRNTRRLRVSALPSAVHTTRAGAHAPREQVYEADAFIGGSGPCGGGGVARASWRTERGKETDRPGRHSELPRHRRDVAVHGRQVVLVPARAA